MWLLAMFSFNSYMIETLFLADLDLAVTLVSIFIRGCGICCVCVQICFVTELFPTPVRQKALGTITAVGGLSTIAASFGGIPLVSGIIIRCKL